MVAQTPKWGLSVEEPGDPSDMPSATGRMQASVEAALDRVVTQYVAADTQVANTRVAKAGDTMTGDLVVKKANNYSQIRLMSNTDGYWLSVDPGAGGLSVAKLTAAGAYVSTYFVCHADGSVAIPSGVLKPQGGVSLSDTTVPNATEVQNEQWRWMIYRADGRVTRLVDSNFRLYVFQIINSSSRRFKRNITHATDVPDVTRLRPRTFTWQPDGLHEVATPGDRLGLIAEEAADVDERLVTRDAEGQVAGLDTAALIAALVAEVQALKTRVAVLEGGVS